MDEKDLIDRLRQGDEDALRALLRRHTPLLRYVLKPLLPDERDREECLADISMKLWQNASLYDEKRGSFRTWLTVLARNSALNSVRTRGWMKNSWEKNAKGKLQHTSFSQLASSVTTWKPA